MLQMDMLLIGLEKLEITIKNPWKVQASRPDVNVMRV
jgi:hypothetical protein